MSGGRFLGGFVDDLYSGTFLPDLNAQAARSYSLAATSPSHEGTDMNSASPFPAARVSH